jgi:hypothetical protein
MMMPRETSRWQCGQMAGRASSIRSGIAYSGRASSKPASAQTRAVSGVQRLTTEAYRRGPEGLGI